MTDKVIWRGAVIGGWSPAVAWWTRVLHRPPSPPYLILDSSDGTVKRIRLRFEDYRNAT